MRGGVAFLRRKDFLLYALESAREDIGDLLLGIVVGDAIGVERRFPEDSRALRVPLILLDVKLRLIVLHRQRAIDDLVCRLLLEKKKKQKLHESSNLEREGSGT